MIDQSRAPPLPSRGPPGTDSAAGQVNLSWNALRHRGAMAIARALEHNVTLTHCNLAWNGFGTGFGTGAGQVMVRHHDCPMTAPPPYD